MNEASEREYSQFGHARGSALPRVAYALTGEQHAAGDLPQTALQGDAALVEDQR